MSPLLFIIVMSALMQDVTELLSPAAKEAYRKGELADIAYVDDTLLLGICGDHLNE